MRSLNAIRCERAIKRARAGVAVLPVEVTVKALTAALARRNLVPAGAALDRGRLAAQAALVIADWIAETQSEIPDAGFAHRVGMGGDTMRRHGG